MPSPFPGMDPYVERGDVWPEFHNPLMIYARDTLRPCLPRGYIARLELRIFTDRDPGPGLSPPRVPDLELIRTGTTSRVTASEHEEGFETELGGYWVSSRLVERREVSIAVRRVSDGELVTAVELLSPSNKHAGEGRDKYLQKQSELLQAGRNLVEIDLLRGGLHTVAVDRASMAIYRPYDYLLCIHRSAQPSGFRVHPWTLRQSLPVCPIPLAPGDPELRLDLQSLFERAYDNASGPMLVDYSLEPVPRLGREDAVWADDLLRRAGLRADRPN